MLASKLQLEPAAISKYETNRVPIPQEYIIKICNLFNISVDYLIGNSDIPNTNIISESELFNLINSLSQEKIDILKQFIEILTKEK